MRHFEVTVGRVETERQPARHFAAAPNVATPRSRSIGNALRSRGWLPGREIIVLSDGDPSLTAIFFVRWLCSWLFSDPFVAPPPALDQQIWTPWAVGMAGLAAMVGHSRSIWPKFSGGKAVVPLGL